MSQGEEVEVAMPTEGALRSHLEAIGVRCRVIESGRALEGLSRRYGSAQAVGADRCGPPPPTSARSANGCRR